MSSILVHYVNDQVHNYRNDPIGHDDGKQRQHILRITNMHMLYKIK